MQENLPAALANNSVVTLTLPIGFSWNTTNAVLSATTSGGATTVGTLAASGNVLTYTVGAAGQTVLLPSKITISGLSVSAPMFGSISSQKNLTVTASGSVSAAVIPYLYIYGESSPIHRNGPIANVYTFRNYASGKNGGALGVKVNFVESLAGTFRANTSIKLNLANAVAGSTTSGVTTVSSGPSFTNPTGSVQFSAATATVAFPGYNNAGAIFSPSVFSYNILAESTSALTNILTLGNLTIGPAVGPVSVTMASDAFGAQGAVTVADATNATNTSTTGSIPNAAIGGSAVTLPTITVTEAAAGALQTEVGGIGDVSFTLANGVWDVAASQSATWCGAALPESNITGSSTNILTVRLASVSTAACALVVNGKAKAALTTAPGAAISVKVNATLSDTGQATPQGLQVATVSSVTPCCVQPFPPTTTITTAATATGVTFTPVFRSPSSDQGKKTDIYIIGHYQGIFYYKKKEPAACAGWTIFSPQTGEIAQAYEGSVTLGTAYQFGNINDCDVTAIKGVSYYIGYGVGAGAAQTWVNMLANGTFSNSPVFLTN